MPPSRRHSRSTTPPSRRPRVAGLRRPSAAGSATTDHPDLLEPESPEVESTEVLDEPAVDTGYTPPVWREPATPEEPPADEDVVVQPETQPEETVEEAADTAVEPEPAPRVSRPSGKRRAVGSTQPADLTAAEAEVGDRDIDDGPPANPNLVKAIVLGVAVIVLAALAIWFRGEANSRSEGADANNQALIDTAKSSEVVGHVRDAIEKSLSYNYTDLDSTAKAVDANLSGQARCEHEQLFGEVRKLAPEQKLILTTRVVQIGVVRLDGDRAELLVMVDQTSTRADQNQTAASASQFVTRAERQGGTWKITQLDMLGQTRPNGQPLPQC